MGVLSDIFHKIFPSDHPAVVNAAAPSVNATAPAPGDVAAAPPPMSMPPVNVEAVLTEKAEKTPEKLDWQASIVDLMKLLGLDSSLANRKQLAHELGYTGDTNDSATMNVWLHKQVMERLAANGGQVPAGMR